MKPSIAREKWKGVLGLGLLNTRCGYPTITIRDFIYDDICFKYKSITIFCF